MQRRLKAGYKQNVGLNLRILTSELTGLPICDEVGHITVRYEPGAGFIWRLLVSTASHIGFVVDGYGCQHAGVVGQ